MPVYRALPGIPRVQKFLPVIIGLTAIGAVFDLAQAGIALANSGSAQTATYDRGETVLILTAVGMLLKGIAGLTFLFMAIQDTADHDVEFNMPPGVAFLACCVPPLMMVLPFAFLNIIVGHVETKTDTKLPAVKLLLWLWCGFAIAANWSTLVQDAEHLSSDRSPVGDVLQAILWTAASVVSIAAMVNIASAITHTRKQVIRESAKLLGPSPDPGFSGTGPQWDPNDPFRPKH